MRRERFMVGVFALSLAVFTVIGAAAFWYFGQFGQAAEWVRHTQHLLTKLEEGFGELKDAETGQRGYLLTGNDRFLEPYHRSMGLVNIRFAEVHELIADNPAQQRRLAALLPLIEEKLGFTQQTVDTYAAGDREQAIEMVLSARGKDLMEAIRAGIEQMQSAERELLAARIERSQRAAWQTNVLILLGHGFAFALLATGTILLGRELNRRRGLEQELHLQEARQQFLEREREQQRQLKAVLDEMPVGVALFKPPDGKVTFYNAWLDKRFGRELSGCEADADYSCFGFLRVDGTPYPPDALPFARALRGETVRGEQLEARNDEQSVPMLASAAPVRDHADHVVAAVGILDDYSGERLRDAERRRANRFRQLFVSALGHDIRNPLSVISTGAASLLRRPLGMAEGKVVQRMAWSAERMGRMVDQLLDISEIRLGGGIVLERVRGDLGEIARRTVERLEVMHPDRTIDLVLEGELDGEWDAARMGQVLTYLIVNALEHGRADRPVRVRLSGLAEEIVIDVHNEGSPIPPDLLPLIFDPFHRAAERKRLKSTGLGLGLYLALHIVREHGGSIDVDSRDDFGTTFRVYLPR